MNIKKIKETTIITLKTILIVAILISFGIGILYMSYWAMVTTMAVIVKLSKLLFAIVGILIIALWINVHKINKILNEE